MDRAPACGADGCVFESRREHFLFLIQSQQGILFSTAVPLSDL